MYVKRLMPSYIAAFDPLAGTPPVYQIMDSMTFTDWSCYRYVSLSFLFTGGREDSVIVIYVDKLKPSYIAAFDPLAGTPPVYQIIDGMTFTAWSCYRYVSLSCIFTGGREDSVNCYVCG